MSIYSYLFSNYVFVDKNNFVFFSYSSMLGILLIIEKISSLYRGYQGEKLHK